MSFSTGKYKHWINELLCQWLSTRKQRPLRILETCQGLGDATALYNGYGYVISFEKELSIYTQARNRFPDAFSLNVCLKKNEDLTNLAERYKESAGSFPVLMPNENRKAEYGIKTLINYKLRFDLFNPFSCFSYCPFVFNK